MNWIIKWFPSPWRQLAGVLAACSVASACGGGVDSGGTGAPMAMSSGRITGFSSIIVNGVRYDETGAILVDDDGAVRSRSDLKLGMMVEVDSAPPATDASNGISTAVASRIQFGSAIKGAVESVNLAASTMVVLGQTVKLDASTFFSGNATGLAGVTPGQLVEVHALLDPSTGIYAASRVDLRTSLDEYKLRGIVSQLDTTAKTFFIGSARISYADATGSPLPTLANGVAVKVKMQTSASSGTWIATKVDSARRNIAEGSSAEVEGIVSSYAGLASFVVDGVTVDASGAGVIFKKGTNGQLANGVRVEIEGVVRNGVLVASKVEYRRAETDEDDDDDDDGVRLKGAIESVDAVARTFVIRGTTVAYDNATRFTRGNAASLAAGASVDVKGVVSAGGTRVYARKIRFE